MGRRHRIVRGVIGVPLAVGLLLAVGCAGRSYRSDYSRQLLSQSEKAVNEAKAGSASQVAQAELKEAEETLSRARMAYAREEYEKAARLAKEASVAAEFAKARATTEKTRTRAEEMRKNLEAMRQDIEREFQPK